jgi:hypothetical protein
MPKKEPVAKGEGKKVTPVMRQWEEAKAAFPDALLFFRLGDFFELFGDDAVTASEVLGITLTSRNKGAMEELPMAGVPHHAAHGYVARLLAAGHKVAICEQMADPSKVKGIVPRAVVRVVTPGLVTDDDQLEARENHWLAAVVAHMLRRSPVRATSGAATASRSSICRPESSRRPQLDTGAELVCELVRSSPREILLAPEANALREAIRLALPRAVLRDEPALDASAHATLSRVLSPELADEAVREHAPLALDAAAFVLGFAQRNTPGTSLPVRRIGKLSSAPTLQIDETAQAHLELVRALDGGKKGTLLETVDVTVTSPGARLLRTRLLAPLADPLLMQRRHDEVEAFVLARTFAQRAARGAHAHRRSRAARGACRARRRDAARSRWAARLARSRARGSCRDETHPRARQERGGVGRGRSGERARRSLRRGARRSPADDAQRGRPRARRLRRRARPRARAREGRHRARARARGGAQARDRRTEPQGPLHTRLRLVHRGQQGPALQGARELPAQADDRAGRALLDRQARPARRRYRERARSCARTRSGDLRALLAEARAAELRLRTLARSSHAGTSPPRSPRSRTATTTCAPPSTPPTRSRSSTAATRSSSATPRRGASCPTTSRSISPRAASGSSPAPTWPASRPSCARSRSRSCSPRPAATCPRGARASASSTGCSRAWVRATTSRAARAPSWSRCARRPPS